MVSLQKPAKQGSNKDTARRTRPLESDARLGPLSQLQDMHYLCDPRRSRAFSSLRFSGKRSGGVPPLFLRSSKGSQRKATMFVSSCFVCVFLFFWVGAGVLSKTNYAGKPMGRCKFLVCTGPMRLHNQKYIWLGPRWVYTCFSQLSRSLLPDCLRQVKHDALACRVKRLS